MKPFCLLSDPQAYSPDGSDLLKDAAEREYWLGHFRQGFKHAMELAAKQYGAKALKRIAAAQDKFAARVEQIRREPHCMDGRLRVIDLDVLRQQILHEHLLQDPYADLKRRANQAAMQLYLPVVRRVHAAPGADKWLHLVQCVFAGNLYDLGSQLEMEIGRDPEDFLSSLEQTRPRPWLVDHFNALGKELRAGPPVKWGKAVLFVDNAGPDFILGLMPLARELSLTGVKVVLAANEAPALNDMTADETAAAVQRLAAIDDDLAALIQAGMFEVVSTGSKIPLLDLSDVSDELNESAADADLVVLEGMGRAVESNYDAAIRTDCVRLALLKNPRVAARLGGQMYDCVCKYDAAAVAQ